MNYYPFKRYTHGASKEVESNDSKVQRNYRTRQHSGFFASGFFNSSDLRNYDKAGRATDKTPSNGKEVRLAEPRSLTSRPPSRMRVMTFRQGFVSLVQERFMSNSVLIGGFSVRQIDGLFSLNDLHVASGGDKAHQPSNFQRLDQTKALIAELSNAGISAIETKRGAHGGTYACRELVIAYAAWISAAFHLKVIRVFLNAQVQPPVAATPAPPKRNVIRCKAESVAVTMRLTSGDVAFGIRLQGDHYNMHRFTPGESIELEYAQGATPLADLPIGVHRIAQNGKKAATA